MTQYAVKLQTGLARLNEGVAPWALATLVAATLGSLIQSQLNLLAIARLGGPVDFKDWLITNGHDLLSFMPFYALIVGAAFICAFPVALWLTTYWRAGRPWLICTASVVGLMAAFFIANSVSPLPTLIAATRDLVGYVLMLCAAAVGGWLFHKICPQPRSVTASRLVWFVPIYPVVILAGALVLHFAMRPERNAPIDDVSSRDFTIAIVADDLAHPWSMVFLPDGRKLVTERAGRVRVIDATGALLKEPLAGVPPVLRKGQGGLLDIKLSPQFERDAWVFLAYACGSLEANNLCVSRGELRGNELRNVRRIFRAQPEKATSTQFGSRMTFLPDDTLVVSVGDGFDFREQAQQLQNHFGKFIRLNMDGSVPGDNPFVGMSSRLPEIYSYGHRNAQGIWYDAPSGTLFASEHGPYGGDEVNVIEPGVNYGWPLATHGINYPGDYVSPNESVPGAREPIHHWTPSIAPSGITVYRGAEFPHFDGDLLVSALGAKGVMRLIVEGRKVVGQERLFRDLDKRIRQVLVGPEGALYLLTDHDPGQVLRVEAASSADSG